MLSDAPSGPALRFGSETDDVGLDLAAAGAARASGDDLLRSGPYSHGGASRAARVSAPNGDAIRRVVVPAAEPATGGDPLAAAAADVPLSTPMQLRSASADALQPVLAALREVEAAL